MGGIADGWQTVMPTSHHHHGNDRLYRPQIEQYERQVLAEWRKSKEDWSGMGKHISVTESPEAKTKVHTRFKPIGTLGATQISVVEKVHYSLHNNKYPVCLARKRIKPRRNRTLDILRSEALVMERLDHEHIIKLVGTYSIRYNELYLLIWPVAVCDLSSFLDDIDAFEHNQGDSEDILERFEALNLQKSDLGRDKAGDVDYRQRLYQLMGCITRATAYCHSNHIRHLDLKPSNILLAPGRVYLADFGIAKDVNDRDHTHTLGVLGTPKWRAPEMSNIEDEWSMKAADIYALGMVLLNIAAVLYDANLLEFDRILCDLHPTSRAEKLEQYQSQLAMVALASQEVRDPLDPTIAPKHMINLASRMVSPDPRARLSAVEVDKGLVELGGVEQLYHSSCCKKSSRYLTELFDMRQNVLVKQNQKLQEDNSRMAGRLKELEGMDETYQMRLRNADQKHAKDIENLKRLLEDERQERKRLENQIDEAQSDRRRPGHASKVGLNMRYAGRLQPPATGSDSSFTTVTFAPKPKKPSGYPNSFASAAAAAVRESPGSSPRPEMVPKRSTSGSTSVSKLPLAVSPATPIRSRAHTPNPIRDPSLTDSTQCSMSSSTFSRLSASTKDTNSAAQSPAISGSPYLNRDAAKPVTNGPPMVSGAGLAITNLPLENGRQNMNDDSASVQSNDPPEGLSSAPSGPASSSPRTTKAKVGPQQSPRSMVKIPSLPTAKSWADVLRTERMVQA